MANVSLKDKKGDLVEYNDVSCLKGPCKDDNGNISKRKFTLLSHLKVYAVKNAGSTNGTAQYEILDMLSYIPTDDCLMFSITDDKYQSYGTDGVICFVTTKSLTVGNIYLATDMY